MEGEAKGGVDSISSISTVSSESDSGEEVFSFAYAASSPAPPPIQKQLTKGEPLLDMSSLLHQLPIKRGLSKHYEGKSQSFTSLSEVTCLEDLAKRENPANKRLKSCKKYAVIAENHPRSKEPSSSKRKQSQKSASTKSSFSNDSALFA